MPASVFNEVTIQAPAGSVAPATQIVSASGLDVLVFNTSTTTTVYLSETNSSLSTDAGTPRVSPLGPQQSIVFNGDLDVFGLVAPGSSAVLNLYPSATNYTPFTGVTSLSQGGSLSGSPFGPIPPGSTISLLSKFDVSLYNTYDLSMFLVNTAMNTVGSALCCRVTLSWYDDLVTNVPVFVEIWNPWVVNSIPVGGIIGSGPMHGKYFSITIQNPGVNAVTIQYINIFGSPRTSPVSDWRQFLNDQVQDAVLVNLFNTAIGFDNSIADTGGFFNLLPNTTYFMPFCLYAGPVAIGYIIGAGVNLSAFNIIDLGGNPLSNTSGNVNAAIGSLYTPGLVSGPGQNNVQLILPRSGCALYLHVGAGGGTFDFKVIAQQGP